MDKSRGFLLTVILITFFSLSFLFSLFAFFWLSSGVSYNFLGMLFYLLMMAWSILTFIGLWRLKYWGIFLALIPLVLVLVSIVIAYFQKTLTLTPESGGPPLIALIINTIPFLALYLSIFLKIRDFESGL